MRFRIYLNNTLEGPFDVSELCELPGFALTTSVCPDGECDWQPAAAYPLITRQLEKRMVSGDYSAEETMPLRLPEMPETSRQNWRAAIIPAQVPERDRASLRPAPASLPTTVAISGSVAARRFGAKPIVLDRLQKILLRERKRLLLLVLGVTAVATCTPQRDNIRMIIDVFTNPDTVALPLPRHHGKNPGHPAGLWKWFKASRSAPAAPSAAMTTKPLVKPSEEITEIASDDLGDGTVKKTVVITREIDGVKISTTKSYIISARKARSRKH